jgi:tetratricopeptide (TPR) repeat protein
MLLMVCVGVALVLGHALVSIQRDRRVVRSMNALALQGLHAEVIDHPLPSRRVRPAARVLQAGCAVRTGRYAEALALLRGLGPQVRGATPEGVVLLRGAALVGLGHYREAAALLGDDPSFDSWRRLRAAVAFEVGDDSLAERLLALPHADELEEAGRLRSLGDLHLRRGRVEEAGELVTRARSLYTRLDGPGVDVDEAYCSVVLARIALAQDCPEQASALAAQGLAGLRRRPDNAPCLAEAHAVAAETSAATGDAAGAQEHLRQAHAQAARCGSAALDAELARAAAQVSLRLGQPAEARRWLLEAARRHDDLGAAPAAESLRRQLAALDA